MCYIRGCAPSITLKSLGSLPADSFYWCYDSTIMVYVCREGWVAVNLQRLCFVLVFFFFQLFFCCRASVHPDFPTHFILLLYLVTSSFQGFLLKLDPVDIDVRVNAARIDMIDTQVPWRLSGLLTVRGRFFLPNTNQATDRRVASNTGTGYVASSRGGHTCLQP